VADQVPLLQIIHVTDLHVQKGRGDRQALAADDRRGQLWLRQQLEKHDLGGWHEGTLGHDETAVAKFEQFLRGLRANDPTWFTDNGGPETWLVDTGDATTSGDRASMQEAHALLDRWEVLLKPCKVRSLFGNHDAWPGTHPAVFQGDQYDGRMAEQRTFLRQRPAWHTEGWLRPLATPAGSGRPQIECYGLNSIGFGWRDNVLAVGEVDGNELGELKQQILNQGAGAAYRILVTHHPVVFPYQPSECKVYGLIRKMFLRNAEDVNRQLLNAEAPAATRSPYVHLFLAGHTHLAYPGAALTENVKELYQGGMGRTQAQLVGGSLMLLRSRHDLKKNDAEAASREPVAGFSDPRVLDAAQQFQVLRFFYDPSMPDGLWMHRFVFARVPNNALGYASIPELASKTFVLHGDEI
jgi:predicted MPP superfamily phosphohydrolase